MSIKYTISEAEDKLAELNATTHSLWVIDGGKLFKHFKFTDFVEAFAFMEKVAVYAEKSNHHPDWSNAYNKVDIYLTTHEVGGLSKRDFLLANLIDGIILDDSGS